MTYASSIAASPRSSLMTSLARSRSPLRACLESMDDCGHLHALELIYHPVHDGPGDQGGPDELEVGGVARERPSPLLGEDPGPIRPGEQLPAHERPRHAARALLTVRQHVADAPDP